MLEIYLELVKDDYVIIFEEYLKIIKEKEYKKEVLKKKIQKYQYRNKRYIKMEKGTFRDKGFFFFKE